MRFIHLLHEGATASVQYHCQAFREIRDGYKDRSNNDTTHKPAVDVGNLKDGQQPGDNGQPRIKNEYKVKEDIKL